MPGQCPMNSSGSDNDRTGAKMVVRAAEIADAPDIARVQVDTWRTQYRGLVPDAFLDGASYEERTQRWTRGLTQAETQQCAYVAQEADGTIVGFATGGPNRDGDPEYAGELYAIYILAAHQGRGIGRRLVRAVAAHLATHGLHSMLVWVLRANPSCRFYAALGGHAVRQRPIEFGGLTHDELGYGWTDTTDLLSRAGG
ncbi:MAG: GNAT family N-acetyltransferase [Chloroflexota bacterium]|nr:GNAT family N-acetyltransferase [Chloroflexota bacterium]